MIRNIFFLLILEIMILLFGYLIFSKFITSLHFSEIAICSSVFFILAVLTMIIFFRGQSRDAESQTMHSLVAVSAKFLLELIFVFIWFIIAKKTGFSSVLLFFILYLTFTLFSVVVILKTLKHKSL